MTQPLLEVKGLKTYFYTEDGVVKAVDGVDFAIEKGETLAVVGESGSGKSITSLSVMGLIQPPGKVTGGQILFKGKDLLKLTKDEMRTIRGNEISMIFQEPMTSLNPVFTVGWQISEALRLHQGLSKKAAKDKASEMLKLVGIPSPDKRVDDYPHQLSGGMRQRVMIAMALACNPDLLIADEPTTALDVTIQAQILDLIRKLQDELGTATLLITHDLGVVADVADRVLVMYAGQPVEYTDVDRLIDSPKHPYTIGLMNSVPNMDEDLEELVPIKGMVPDPRQMPSGCSFHPRCEHVTELCKQEEPPFVSIEQGHQARCWVHTERWEKTGVKGDKNNGQKSAAGY